MMYVIEMLVGHPAKKHVETINESSPKSALRELNRTWFGDLFEVVTIKDPSGNDVTPPK